MPRAIDPLVLSPDQRSELQGWVVALGTPQQVALRCRIILAVAAGNTEMMIAAENGVNRKTVRLWRERFRSNGPQALWDIAPGRGRKPTYDVTRIKALIDTTLQTKPKGTTHWSCRYKTPAELPVLSLRSPPDERARHMNAAARDVGERGASGNCAMTDSRGG